MLRSLAALAVCLLALAPAGCQKKPAGKGSTSGGAMSEEASRETGRARPVRPARGAAGARASALCAEGARPDRPVAKDQYELTVKVPAEGAPGATVTAEVVVTPKAGYKVNLKYPAELTVKTASDGVALPKAKLEKGDAKALDEKQLHFQVPVALKTGGRKVIQGELGFSVCTPKLCITEPDMCVAWEVTAK